jgi:hypothetical protein
MPPNWTPIGQILLVVIAVWLIYLSIEVARHVNAWPFS